MLFLLIRFRCQRNQCCKQKNSHWMECLNDPSRFVSPVNPFRGRSCFRLLIFFDSGQACRSLEARHVEHDKPGQNDKARWPDPPCSVKYQRQNTAKDYQDANAIIHLFVCLHSTSALTFKGPQAPSNVRRPCRMLLCFNPKTIPESPKGQVCQVRT